MIADREPTVSFIVPCYKMAHLLPQCINSILTQSFRDFEILIMDDCSPDDTAEVAGSFSDPRVKHIRNEQNLGHLRNYNKGIASCRGKYVWLISADDYLRRSHVLQKYVDLLESNPRIGYVFSSGYGVRDGSETRILGQYARHHDRDRVLSGHALLARLLRSNFVLAPSAMARKECYTKLGAFELNMPWCGDWYMWCLFAIHYDVGYFSEQMICYREHHDLSMTSQLIRGKLDECAAEEIAVAWTIREKALQAGFLKLAAECLSAIANTYARVMSTERYRNSSWFMNLKLFEESLRGRRLSKSEQNSLQAQLNSYIGDEHYRCGRFADARTSYRNALRIRPQLLGTRVKALWASLGRPGQHFYKALRPLN